jgi:hypothetical protein
MRGGIRTDDEVEIVWSHDGGHLVKRELELRTIDELLMCPWM